ncbi:hypothetical protein CRG98_001683, partial [Punica granatum]
MAGIAGTCSAGVLPRGRESGAISRASSLVQYNGLRPVDSVKMAVTSSVSANGIVSSAS